jgi:PAS domain S-box-containing protein
LLPPLSILLSLLVALLGGVLVTARKESLDAETRHMFSDTQDDLRAILELQADGLGMLIDSITRSPIMKHLLIDQDQDALQALFDPLYRSLRDHHDINHFSFHLPDGVNLLRLHQPDRHGDLITHFTRKKAARTDAPAWGVELGPLGTLTLRVARPVTNEGKRIGFVELGREIYDALERAHTMDQIDLAILIDKVRLRREDWEVGMAMLGRSADWSRFPAHVLVYSSRAEVERLVPRLIHTGEAGAPDEPGEVFERLQTDSSQWHARVLPYRDADGTVIGRLVVARDVTGALTDFRWLAGGIIAATVLILGTLLVVLSTILRRTDRDILTHQGKLAASEERLRATLLSIGDAVVTTDPDGRVTQMNPVAETMTGWTSAEATGRPLDEVFIIRNAGTGTPVESPVQAVLANGQPVELGNDTVLAARNGTDRQIADSAAPIRTPDGAMLGVVLVFRDVTEIYQARKEVQRLNERFRIAVESAGIGVWELDLQMQALIWDERMYALYGCGDDRPGGGYDLWAERLHPDDRARAEAEVQAAITDSGLLDTGFRVVWPAGDVRHLRAFAKTVRDASGKPLCMIGVNYDITDMRHLAERLRTSERRFRDIVESMSDWVWEIDRNGLLTYVSGRVVANLGRQPRELLGRPPRDFLIENDAERFEAALQAAAATGDAFKSLETWARAKDGTLVRLASSGLPIFDDEGRLRGFRGTNTDVTERRQIEDVLRLRTRALDAAANGILIVRADGDQPIVYCNPAFERMTGYTQKDATGRNCRFLQGEDHDQPDLGDMAARLVDASPDEERFHGLLRLFTKLGGAFWAQVAIAPVRDGASAPTHFVAVLEDVSDRIARERDLREARELAEQASVAKSTFLARMSHELRTPLNAIIGFSEMMEHQVFGPVGQHQYTEYVRDIRLSGEYLLALINDVLDMAKVESGRLTLEESRFQPRDALDAAMSMMIRRAEQRSLSLDVAVDESISELYFDVRAFKQMVINLVSNALKFTQAGGRITVELSRREDGTAALRVRDTGIGIPPNELSKVLEPFHQSALTRETTEPGTGLGLALVKSLIELHGGTIALDSTVNAGTTVTLTFPARRVVSASSGTDVADPGR